LDIYSLGVNFKDEILARYCGGRNSGLLISNANEFKEVCLIQGKSMFTDKPVWTSEHCNELIVHFVKNLDEGEGNFIEKLEIQLADASPEAKALSAEMLWLMFLCPSNTGPASKRKSIERVFSWSHFQIEQTKWELYLSDEALTGIGSVGIAYNTGRWRELVYLIRFAEKFLKLDPTYKKLVLSEHHQFAKWLESVDDNENRQLRHILLFLFFPDEHERIFAEPVRKEIILKLTDISKAEYRKLKSRDIDEELLKLRKQFEQEFGTTDIDYYVEPLKTKWKSAEAKVCDGVQEPKEDYAVKKLERYANSLNQILYGPPGTGKTYNTINQALAIVVVA